MSNKGTYFVCYAYHIDNEKQLIKDTTVTINNDISEQLFITTLKHGVATNGIDRDVAFITIVNFIKLY